MIILSNTVSNVLDKFYFKDIVKPEQTLYYKCLDAIKSLDRGIPYGGTIIAKDEKYPFNWRIEQTLVLKVGRYCFSYEKDEENIYVSEVFDLQTRQLLEHKKHDIEHVPLFEEFCSMI